MTNRKTPVPDSILEAARRLRKGETDAERHLWHLLRRKQLGGFKFRRQHPIGPFILDFYCHEAKLGIELDGGVHTMPEQQRRDGERSEAIEGERIQVIRFWNREVTKETERILTAIWNELQRSSEEQS